MKKVKSLLMALAFVLVALPVSFVSAQSSSTGGSGLSITPTRSELVIERGKSDLVSIQVKNVTDRPILARAFLNDFEAEGLSGNPKLIIDANQEQSANSIRDFISGLEDITIDPGETSVVNVPITIPENAAPGAYYGAVRFQSAPAGSGDQSATTPQVALNASVASLVLIEVPGDITERIEVDSVGAYLNDKKGSLFTKKPTKVGVQIDNLGNGFSKPFGTVRVRGPWGNKEILNYELNDTSPRGNVLPSSSRLFLKDFDQVKWPGRYTIEANVSHGSGGEVLTATTSFWYLPLWLIISLLVVILTLATLVYVLYRRFSAKRHSSR